MENVKFFHVDTVIFIKQPMRQSEKGLTNPDRLIFLEYF